MLMKHLHLNFSCTSRIHYFLVAAPIVTLVTLISRSCLKSSTVVSVLGSATSLSKSTLLAYTLPVLLCFIISFASAGIFIISLIFAYVLVYCIFYCVATSFFYLDSSRVFYVVFLVYF